MNIKGARLIIAYDYRFMTVWMYTIRFSLEAMRAIWTEPMKNQKYTHCTDFYDLHISQLTR